MRWRWLLLCLGPVGCGDPCKDLAEKVCACAPTAAEQEACAQRLGQLAQQQGANGATRSRCAELLARGQCTCKQLASGDLTACGQAE